jgi:hypothetical protein
MQTQIRNPSEKNGKSMAPENRLNKHMRKTLLSCKHLRNISLNADVNFHLLSISEVGRMFNSRIPYFINIK